MSNVEKVSNLVGLGAVTLPDISISFQIGNDSANMVIMDTITGESIRLSCSRMEFACILALATCSDPDSIPKEVWDTALPVFDTIPTNFRPIP